MESSWIEFKNRQYHKHLSEAVLRRKFLYEQEEQIMLKLQHRLIYGEGEGGGGGNAVSTESSYVEDYVDDYFE